MTPTPELATLFQIQAKLETVVAGLGEVVAALVALPSSPMTVTIPDLPPPLVEVTTSPVDLTDIALGLATLVERVDLLTDVMAKGKTMVIERDKQGRITRVTAEPMRLA